ncbi:MAG: ATP synthase F0 subunit B [Myxococcales bacterium]|nr:ATP synthase F0 subunit B [Myxococcales bacterium]
MDIRRCSLILTAVLLMTSPALAADGFTFNVHGFYIINFVVFVAILGWALKKPLSDYLVNRRNTLLKAIEDAEQLKKQAAASLAQYQKLIGELDREKERILAESRADAERERERILAESEVAAKKLFQEAEKRIHQERRKVEDELRSKLIASAIASAEAVVRERMTPQTHRRLVADSIEALESTTGQETLGRA